MSALEVSEERTVLRAAVTRALAAGDGIRGFIAEEPAADWFDNDLLATLTGIGVSALLVPEELNGPGASMADVAAVFEQLGAYLAPVPLFGTYLAVAALLAFGGDAAAQEAATSLSEIAGGATYALAGLVPVGHDGVVQATLGPDAQWTLSGRCSVVVEGASADRLLVVAESVGQPDTKTLFAVSTTVAGLVRTPLRALDMLRGVSSVDLSDVTAVPVGAVGSWTPRIAGTALDLACVVLAAEQVGVAQHCLDAAVEYAKSRVQFGRPIGARQAIQHELVDLLLDVEMARSIMLFAVDAADDFLSSGTPDAATALTRAAALAKASCSETAMRVSDASLHIHGGTGFTWEHDAHLYFRRAESSLQLLGRPSWHRERFARAALGA